MTTGHWSLLCNVHQFNGAAVGDIVLHASRADNSLCHSPEPPLPPDAGRHQIRRSSHQRASPTEITDGPATPNIFYNGHVVQVQDFNTVAKLKYGGKHAQLYFRG